MTDTSTPPLDSVLLVGFGGPERPEEIMPFLRNVVRGRGIPDERLREVEQHYREVGGRSPYNELTERLRRALEEWLRARGHALPVRVGMRNWRPYLKDTLRGMAAEGLRRAAGIILAAHRSEASRERYLEDLVGAAAEAGDRAPAVLPVEPWHREPGFLEAHAQRLEQGTGERRGHWPADLPVLFTAHSIPVRMAEASPYVEDVHASCDGVARILGLPDWEIAWQSRSGDPRTPWLEPDINDTLRARVRDGVRRAVVHSIGFLSDHVEVLYDLDVEARRTAEEAGIGFRRTPCVNDHPAFVATLGQRVLRLASGTG